MNKFQELYNYCSKLGYDCNLDESMALNTSFKTGGKCRIRLSPKSVDEIIDILKKIKEYNIPYIILGNGTNVLAPQEGLEKAVIVLGSNFSKLELLEDNEISFTSGTNLVTLCRFAYQNSLSGLEFAYGIPGTCGGAVFMNGGAYGGEMSDVLTEITHLTPDFKIETIKAEDAELSYRHSIYKDNGCIILSAKVKLKIDSKENIKAKMDELLGRRKDKQPLEYPSAGSTFKRPEGNFAGALIEKCGLKGKAIGGAQVSEKHAGFIINKGGATSQDVLDLINYVKDYVKKETGYDLEPEVIILR